MSEQSGEPEPTHPYLAKPVSPSGDAASTPPPPPPTAPLPEVAPYQEYQQYQPYAGPPAGPFAGPPAGPAGQGFYPYAFQQVHSGANTSMWLGIASVVCAVAALAICVTLPGVLLGPFAVALGLRAQSQMRQQPGRYSNESAATTGLITGAIGSVVGLIVLGLIVFVIGAFWSVGTWS